MVTRLSSQSEFIAEYRAKFPRSRSRGIITITANSTALDVLIGYGICGAEYVGTFDGDELVSVMSTWIEDDALPYRNIGKTIVEPAYQRNRITRQIIEWWVTSQNECLMSDANQTPEGAGVWESMIMRQTNPQIGFYLWHPDGKEIELTVKAGEIFPNPWAEPHTRLLARPR
jgi:hypothetical protein